MRTNALWRFGFGGACSVHLHAKKARGPPLLLLKENLAGGIISTLGERLSILGLVRRNFLPILFPASKSLVSAASEASRCCANSTLCAVGAQLAPFSIKLICASARNTTSSDAPQPYLPCMSQLHLMWTGRTNRDFTDVCDATEPTLTLMLAFSGQRATYQLNMLLALLNFSLLFWKICRMHVDDILQISI